MVGTHDPSPVVRTERYAEGEFSWHGGSDAGGQVRVIPTAGKFDGVRSFAEQVKHVDCAIRLLQRIRRQEAARLRKWGQIPRAPGGADQLPERFL